MRYISVRFIEDRLKQYAKYDPSNTDAIRELKNLLFIADWVSDDEIYNEVQHNYRLQDARTHLAWYHDVDDEDDEAVDEIVSKYDLEQLVKDFEDEFDCNCTENDAWDNAIMYYKLPCK